MRLIFFTAIAEQQRLSISAVPENAEYMKSKAAAQLMAEIDKGWKSAEEGGWLTLEEVESQLGLTDV